MPDEQHRQPDARAGIIQRLRQIAMGAPGKLRMAAAPLYRFRRLLILCGCVLFVASSVLGTANYVLSLREKVLQDGLTIDAALEKLDAGETIEARQLASMLPRANNLSSTELGEVHFVIGAATVHETDQAWDEPNRAALYALAARHLDQSLKFGMPEGREEAARLMLAKCLIESGQYESSLAPLLELSTDSPVAQTEASRLLAIAWLKKHPPNLEKAAQYGEKYAHGAQAIPAMRNDAALLQAEVALMQGDLQRCDELLKSIPDDAEQINQRQLLRGRLLLAQADRLADESGERTDKLNDLYASAIRGIREAMRHHAIGQSLSSQGSYLIGTVLRRQGQLEAAQDQFFRTRKRYFNTPEGIAASLEEAELLFQLGRIDEAVNTLELTANHVASPQQFVNPYISEKQLRDRIDNAYEQLYMNERFDLAAGLSSKLKPLVGGTVAAQLRADTLHLWGDFLHASAAVKSGTEADDARREGRHKYRLAGYAYAELAQQRYVTRQYPTDLWQAGRSFKLGQDFESAATAFRSYLKTEARTERPMVLIALTEAYLSLNQVEDAITTIEDCMREFRRDPAIYQARLLASTAYLEQGDLNKARQLLEENLHHDALTPRSDAWRDSLFALGMVLHRQGRLAMIAPEPAVSEDPATAKLQHLERGHRLLHEAIRHLSEAVARYPNAPQAIAARYALGESYRYSSRMPLAKFELETIESRRAALNRQINDELDGAIKQYDQIVRLLNEQSHTLGPLSDEDEKILRNVYFARGTVLYDLGDFEAAIKAYSTATSRYQHEPAALEAYVQIAACYRRLNKPLEARGTLEQAKLVMERIGENADFTTTTRYGREEWATLLNWLTSL